MGKKTDTILEPFVGAYVSKDGRMMLEGFRMTFNLSKDDFDILQDLIMPAIPEDDLADAMLAMLTYGIHTAYKDATGNAFVYPFERLKKKGNNKA